MTPYQRAGSRALAGFRTNSGNTITYNGVTVACTTAAAMGDDLQFIPDGERNAANSDNRVFALSPSVGASLVSAPEDLETKQVTWSANSAAYNVTRAYQTAIGTTWRLIAYRVAQAGTSPADAAAITVFDR